MNTTRLLQAPCSLLAAVGLIVLPGLARADVVVSEGPSSNIACAGTVCTPTASQAVLNVGTLDQMLAAGHVTIATTGAGGVQATDIVMEAAPTWTSQTTLALDAYRSIRLGRPIAVQGTASLALTTNDGGTNGMLHIPVRGAVSFPGATGHLIINAVPYTLVGTLAVLAANVAANPAGHFALKADIDAFSNGAYAASPVPTQLSGDFEGLGHTISHLRIVNSIKRGDIYGLFSTVAAGGSIENLALTAESIDVRGSSAIAGGLVGSSLGTLSYVSVTGTIHVTSGWAGGIVAYSAGAMNCASAKVQVHGATVGGLAGVVDRFGTIFGSSSGGHVVSVIERGQANAVAGGLVGSVDTGSIDQSFSTADIEIIVPPNSAGAGVLYLGGLVGTLVQGRIANSFDWRGKVMVRNVAAVPGPRVGGLVGNAESESLNAIQVEHCYAADTIGDHLQTQGGNIGGAFGVVAGGKFLGDYWDTTTTGLFIDAGSNDHDGPTASAMTTPQLQAGLPQGFDPRIWAISSRTNGGFPYLRFSAAQLSD